MLIAFISFINRLESTKIEFLKPLLKNSIKFFSKKNFRSKINITKNGKEYPFFKEIRDGESKLANLLKKIFFVSN